MKIARPPIARKAMAGPTMKCRLPASIGTGDPLPALVPGPGSAERGGARGSLRRSSVPPHTLRTWGCYSRVTALDSAVMPFPSQPSERDHPWVMRTYAGHSSPAESNKLYRNTLAKGQTGLSLPSALPTQTGYDPDDELAVGEVG